MKLKTFLIILAAILCVGLIAGGVARNNGGSAQSVSVRPNSAANNGTAAVTEAPATTEADEPATEPETDEVQGPKILLLISKDMARQYDFTVFEDGEEISPFDSVMYSIGGVSDLRAVGETHYELEVDRYLVTPGNSSFSLEVANSRPADPHPLFQYFYVYYDSSDGTFDSVDSTFYEDSATELPFEIEEDRTFFFIY